MIRARKFLLGAVLTITQFALCQSGGAPASRLPGGSAPEEGTVNSTPQSTLLRILTPGASQKLTDNFTTVRFELLKPSAYAGTPNYVVQMDRNDPITVFQTQQAFRGLAPGAHTVTVYLVDANGTPVPGQRAAIQFFVTPQATKAAGGLPQESASMDSSRDRELGSAGLKSRQPDPNQPQDNPNLPPASSPLPLISIIGFGILVGGIVSAMKTRS